MLSSHSTLTSASSVRTHLFPHALIAKLLDPVQFFSAHTHTHAHQPTHTHTHTHPHTHTNTHTHTHTHKHTERHTHTHVHTHTHIHTERHTHTHVRLRLSSFCSDCKFGWDLSGWQRLPCRFLQGLSGSASYTINFYISSFQGFENGGFYTDLGLRRVVQVSWAFNRLCIESPHGPKPIRQVARVQEPRYLEFFAGQANVYRMISAAGYPACAVDIEYLQGADVKGNAFDILTPEGFGLEP